MTDYPASTTCSHLVAILDDAGFRPQPAHSLPGFPAWGAPKQHTAYCPACCTEGSLIVEAFGKTDPRSVLYCTNAYRCSSHSGATRERDVHMTLLDALDAIIEAS